MGKTKSVKLTLSTISVSDEDLHGYNQIRKLSITRKVQRLPIGAFANKDRLEKVYIEKDSALKAIPEACFMGCTALTDLSPIPESVAAIDDKAFRLCQSLSSITIPDTVAYVSPSAFDGWKAHQTIIMAKAHPLSEKCRATIVIEDAVLEDEDQPVGYETDGELKFYIVRAKGGHVGRQRYMPIDFPIKAVNKKEAAAIAREMGRVKHDHKDAIKSVTHVTEAAYKRQVEMNKEDPYLNVRSKHEQKKHSDTIDERALPDTREVKK